MRPRDWEVLDRVPEGWRVLDGATAHPSKLRWIDNKRSRFSQDRKRALVPEEVAYEWRRNNSRPRDGASV